MRISVIIVTINRPECVQKCLDCLQLQVPRPEQIIVVDASSDNLTQMVVSSYPGCLYLRNEKGLGYTTLSRNIALGHVTGDIVVMLDDDAYVRTGCMAAYQEAFACDPNIAAVAGRALNNQPNEDTEGVHLVGQVAPNGILYGFFAADTGKIVDVDHAIGCNMAIRRDVLARVGGFRDGFSGRYCFREESDIFFVMRALGYRVVFQPNAIVDHVAGPKPKGRRFDNWYAFYAERNHYILLIRNHGLFHPIVCRYFIHAMYQIGREALRGIVHLTVRVFASIGGTAFGIALGVRYWLQQGSSPVRRDVTGKEITLQLTQVFQPSSNIPSDVNPTRWSQSDRCDDSR